MFSLALIILAAAFQLPPQQSDATIGVAAVHLQSGRRVSYRGNERFPMGSVYKFPIAIAVLRHIDRGALTLDQSVTISPREFSPGWSPLRDEAAGKPVTRSVRELLRLMLSVSDNTASDALLRLAGGPAEVSKLVRALGSSAIRIDRSEAEIGADLDLPGGRETYFVDPRDTATPEAMADLLITVWERKAGLSSQSHDLLIKFMTETATGARRIKAAVPPGSTVTHKTGTMPGTTNDAGIVTSPDGQHVVIVIFTKGANDSSMESREADIAAAARRAYETVLQRERNAKS